MPELYRPITSSLRSRLLFLTVVFILVVEMFIYVPAIATYRQGFLEERMVAAQIAGLSLEEAPGNNISPDLERELLATAGVISVIMRREDKSLLLGYDLMPEEPEATFDLTNPSLGTLIIDAFETLDAEGDRIISVRGMPTVAGTRFLEITLAENDLFTAMRQFSNNILILSIIISVFTGVLVYLSLHWMLVRPMRRVRRRIVDFRRQPEVKPNTKGLKSRRRDEIGLVERELSRMQIELQQNLKSKKRLAELGEAVVKINHDLRGILATAQLSSDALSRVRDPRIEKISRRMITAVSRAVALCERTMRHGKSAEPEPEPTWHPLYISFCEVGDALGLMDSDDFKFNISIPKDMTAYMDSDQMHRVFLNICRNGTEAQGGKGEIDISAKKEDNGTVHIVIKDYGPGIPNTAMPNLFKPFLSSNKVGGTGLGLAVARDIVLAHGGQIGLKETCGDGASFLICLPGPDEGPNDNRENTKMVPSDAENSP